MRYRHETADTKIKIEVACCYICRSSFKSVNPLLLNGRASGKNSPSFASGLNMFRARMYLQTDKNTHFAENRITEGTWITCC